MGVVGMGRGARYGQVLGVVALAAVTAAGCGSGGSDGSDRTTSRTSGSATPAATAGAGSSPTSDPAAASLRARNYVLPDSAAPIGFKASPSEPESADDKKVDADVNRCMGLPPDDPRDEADGSDFDNEATSTSVSSSAGIYRADEVARDVTMLGARANQAKFGRCLMAADQKDMSGPDEHGVVSHIEEVTPFDVGYLTHGVAGLRVRLTVQGGQVQKASARGSGPAIVPAVALADAPGITVYTDLIFLGTGRVESSVSVQQVQVTPNQTLERRLALQANARLDHQ